MQRTTFFKKLFFVIAIVASCVSLQAQEVKWMSWEEAVEQSAIAPKKIFVDVYTEWCTWCKKMDETTFADPNVVQYLNENYYSVKLDAQQEADIKFKKETYRFVQNGVNSYHEFAMKIMAGKMKYPTVVFFDEDLQLIQSIPGFRGPFELELFMTYFGEDKHQSQPWFRFKKSKEVQKRNSLQLPVKNRN